MRILNAVSRRALDLPSVQAEAVEQDHQVILVLEVTPKQVGQLLPRMVCDCRCVGRANRTGVAFREECGLAALGPPHPPASAGKPEDGRAPRLASRFQYRRVGA